MSLSDIVQISITSETARVLQAGFGVPLILSPRPTWSERLRTYETLAGMVTDGFTSGTPEYKMAAKLFSQSPSPEEIKVGRCALPPTQRWAITPVAVNGGVYRMWVNDTLISYTADSSATVTEIIAGLKTAIDLLSLGITLSDQTTYMRIVANAAGAWFNVEVDDTALLGIAQDHADPGLATDLAAIALESSDWYGILYPFNSKACIQAIAAYTEANTKLFIAQTQDSAVITTAISGTDDVAEALKSSAYDRTVLIYHPETEAFADAAWAGNCLPRQPGSETWMFKQLASVPAVELSATHRTNLRAKSCNFYETQAGIAITKDGVVSSGKFIDNVRGADWVQARLQERIYGVLANAAKVPFTDAGVALIEAEVRAQLQEGVDVGLFSPDPAPTVTVPKVANVSLANKANRILPDIKFDALYAGAVHKAVLQGVISV